MRRKPNAYTTSLPRSPRFDNSLFLLMKSVNIRFPLALITPGLSAFDRRRRQGIVKIERKQKNYHMIVKCECQSVSMKDVNNNNHSHCKGLGMVE
jgi:hypothetical protein